MTPRPDQPACIALGSNLGERAAHIRAGAEAIAGLPDTAMLALSTLHETDPVGPVPQGRYLNAAAVISTSLPPRRLLDCLLRIEKDRGRDRSKSERWGARTLDLDLLLYGDLVIDQPGLTIPHPRLHERRFVLAPLAEVAADFLIPTLNTTVAQALRRLDAPPGEARRLQ